MPKIDLAEDPVLYNKLYQGGKKYPGNDKTNEGYIITTPKINLQYPSIINLKINKLFFFAF